MGHVSIVYGKIIGPKWMQEDYLKLQLMNREVLKSLPITDNFPWIHRNMFHCMDPKNIEGTYRRQVITFGASYKSVEYDWEEWLEKFEKILKQLYWRRATIHLETELVKSHTYEWISSDEQKDKWSAGNLEPISEWEFIGGPRKFFL
jgi:hypothetical protein